MKKVSLSSLMLALILTGCGDSKEETATTAENQTSVTQTAKETAEAAEKVAKEVEKAKEKAKETLEEAQEAFNKGDFESAFELAEEAADAGNLPEAQFLLGQLYFNGQGTERNIKEAYKWLTLADIYKVEGTRPLMAQSYRALSAEERDEVSNMVKTYLDSH